MAYPRFDNFNSRFFEPILILSLQDLGSIARELALLSYCPAICELLLGSKRGRKMGKNALKYGAVAGVGALAWKAYQNYQTNTQQAATPSPSVEQQGQQLDQLARVPQEQRGLQILQAMIMAARADGHIDGKERELLSQEIAKLQPDDELHSWIQQQFDAPLILLSLHEQLIALKVRGRFTW